MRLNRKVAIVTGGASGIGRATAMLFAGEGARVAIADINSAGGMETVEHIKLQKGEAVFIPTDVSKLADARALAAQTVKHFGRIDVLVNVAGIAAFHNIEQTEEHELDRVLSVNLKSIFFCAQAVIPHMKQAGGGSIVNTASITGIVGAPGLAAYSASKGAIITLTRTMALELAEANIRVNCLCPATVDTPMVREALAKAANPAQAREQNLKRHPLGRFATPEDVANFALFLASDESSFVTGGTHIIDGGAILARRWKED